MYLSELKEVISVYLTAPPCLPAFSAFFAFCHFYFLSALSSIYLFFMYLLAYLFALSFSFCYKLSFQPNDVSLWSYSVQVNLLDKHECHGSLSDWKAQSS